VGFTPRCGRGAPFFALFFHSHSHTSEPLRPFDKDHLLWNCCWPFLAALLPVAGVLSKARWAIHPRPMPLRNGAVWWGVGVWWWAGLVIALLGTANGEQKLKQSRGVFSIGIGVLVVLATFHRSVYPRRKILLAPRWQTVYARLMWRLCRRLPTLAGPTTYPYGCSIGYHYPYTKP